MLIFAVTMARLEILIKVDLLAANGLVELANAEMSNIYTFAAGAALIGPATAAVAAAAESQGIIAAMDAAIKSATSI
jgi:hypothetical protein